MQKLIITSIIILCIFSNWVLGLNFSDNVSKDTYLINADILFDSNLVGKATEQYELSLQYNENDSIAYYGLGKCFAYQGDIDTAIIYFDKAISGDSKYFNAYFAKGYCYNAKGLYDSAIIAYENAVLLNNGFLEAYHNLAFSYLGKGDIQNAIEYYNTSVSLDPDCGRAYYGLSLCYQASNNNQLANSNYQKAEKLISTTISIAFYNLAAYIQDKYRIDHVIYKKLNPLILQNSNDASTWFEYANCYKEIGIIENEILRLMSDLLYSPGFNISIKDDVNYRYKYLAVKAYRTATELYIKQGFKDKAIKCINVIKKLEPYSPHIEELEYSLKNDLALPDIDHLVNTLLHSSSPFNRSEAIELLGKSNDTRAISPLINVLNTEPSFKNIAAEALGRLKALDAINPLILLLREKSIYTRSYASQALGRIGSPAVPHLIKHLNDSDTDFSKWIIATLEDVNDSEAIKSLVSVMNNKKHPLRKTAVFYLGGNLKALDSLIINLKDEIDTDVKSTNIAALGRFRDNSKAAEAIVNELKNFKYPSRLYNRIYEEVHRIGKPALISLIKAFHGNNKNQKENAGFILKRSEAWFGRYPEWRNWFSKN